LAGETMTGHPEPEVQMGVDDSRGRAGALALEDAPFMVEPIQWKAGECVRERPGERGDVSPGCVRVEHRPCPIDPRIVVVARLAQRTHRQVLDQVGQAALVHTLVRPTDARLQREHGLSRRV
jgi:hypothetical protein